MEDGGKEAGGGREDMDILLVGEEESERAGEGTGDEEGEERGSELEEVVVGAERTSLSTCCHAAPSVTDCTAVSRLI